MGSWLTRWDWARRSNPLLSWATWLRPMGYGAHSSWLLQPPPFITGSRSCRGNPSLYLCCSLSLLRDMGFLPHDYSSFHTTYCQQDPLSHFFNITPASTLHNWQQELQRWSLSNTWFGFTSSLLLQLLPWILGNRSCRGDLSLASLCLSLLDVTCGYIHVIYLTYTIGSRSCSGNFFLSLSHTHSLSSLSLTLSL